MTHWLISIGVVLLVPTVFVVRVVLKRLRRKRVLAVPFPDTWLEIMHKNIPIYKKLPPPLQAQLQDLIRIFLDEKTFYGHDGVEITDEVRVTVAAQACLLLLNRETEVYPHLHTIEMYPAAFREKNPDGDRPVRIGESWTRGCVVLAWDHSKGDAYNFHDGHNVVIHEFSHQLDQLDGRADGAPILENAGSYQSWGQVLSKDYLALRKKVERHKKDLLDEYGATNPAEFFAVATEVFFEQPARLAKGHPELFNELQGYYKVDPREWL